MRNHNAVSKTVVTAACTLAIAILIIGMGVNSTLAAPDTPAPLNFTPISSTPSPPRTLRLVFTTVLIQRSPKYVPNLGRGVADQPTATSLNQAPASQYTHAAQELRHV